MKEKNLQIVSFGLIKEDKSGKLSRQVRFEDLHNQKMGELIITPEGYADLWSLVTQMEKGDQIGPIEGYIGEFNQKDIVVIGSGSLEEAFKRQEWKYEVAGKISFADAEKKRESSQGYATNLSKDNCMEINWRPIDSEVRLIRFRKYIGEGLFEWSKWFEIS